MGLFLTSLKITLKHSGKRLIFLLLVFAVCFGVVFTAFSSAPDKEPSPLASIGIINNDTHPISSFALSSVDDLGRASSLFSAQIISPAQKDFSVFTAVITIPEGFIESVMNGTNLSPGVEVNISSPMEASFARQMAYVGAKYLSSAQLGIYTVLNQAQYGAEMSAQAYQQLLLGVNLEFMRLFLDRLTLIEEHLLSATGALGLKGYYIVSICVMLVFMYAFLYTPAVLVLFSFSRSCRRCPGSARALFFSSLVSCALLELALLLPLYLAVKRYFSFALSPSHLAALGLLSLLFASFVLLCALLTLEVKAAAALGIFLSLGMGVISGGFLPLELMPQVLRKIAPWTVHYQGAALMGGFFTPQPASFWPPAVMTGVLLAVCGFLWRWRLGKGAV